MKSRYPLSTRNAWVSLAVTFLSDLAFILPIWILFGTHDLGLSVTVTTALFMTIWFGSGLLEIPTGALADRLGRKRIYLFGMALLALYPLIYIFKVPLPLMFAISAVAAFGSALRSGTLIPLTYDSFQKEKRNDQDYHKFLSSGNTLTFIARALSGVAGGFLYAYDHRAPYVAMLVVYILALVVGAFAVDTAQRSTLKNRAHIADAVRQMARTPLIIMLLVMYISFQLVGEAMWTAYQPLFAADGLSAQAIGTIFSVIAVLSAVSAYCTRFIMQRVGVLLIEVLAAAAVLLTTFMLFVPSDVVHLLAIIPSSLAFGISITPLIATTQKYVKTTFHSTALSVINVAQYCVYGFASLYISVVIDHFGTAAARRVLFVEALAVTVALAVYYLRQRGSDEVVTPVSEKA